MFATLDRAGWESLVFYWQFFPLITVLQWVLDWYPAGKTSIVSRWNLPGKLAWMTMEAPGFLLLLYIMYTLPAERGLTRLPWQNWLMASLFTVHYIYRSLLCPLLNQSMSPIHIFVWSGALMFQLVNATSLGGYLAGYGPTSIDQWVGSSERVEVGMMIWALGFMANIYHDDELREIRRVARRRQAQRQRAKGDDEGARNGVDKVYMIPENGLFRLVLFPHYLTEWIEWAGLWLVAGPDCVPMRIFLLNEIATMLPRALQGKRWYEHRFGKDKIAGKKAVIPWLL